MKRKIFRNLLLPASLLMLIGIMLAGPPGTAIAQTNVGPGFSYQGYLEENGHPVNGTCTLAFRLFDDLTGGNQLGVTQSISGVTVTEGLFAVTLNEGNEFGDDAFNGQVRWLEIDVGCGHGHTTLSPRQELLAVPYAHSLRPGATISGMVPNDSGVLNLTGSNYGLRVVATGNHGIYVDQAAGDGIHVDNAANNGIDTHGAHYGGIFQGGSAGVFAYAHSATGPDLVLGGYFDGEGVPLTDGRISTWDISEDSSMYLLSNHDVTVRLDADGSHSPLSTFTVAEGAEPENANNDVTRLRVNEEGVEAQRFFVEDLGGHPGEGIFFDANPAGVYVRSVADFFPDLVLGGSGGSDSSTIDSGDDDGIIRSQTGSGFLHSDLVLRSNDRVSIDLNADGTPADEDSDFEVRDSHRNILFDVDSGGNVGIGTSSPQTKLEISSPNFNDHLVLNRDEFGGGPMHVTATNPRGLAITDGTDTFVYVEQATGNVGIGTINPDNFRLAVNGPIRATSLTNSGPDLVVGGIDNSLTGDDGIIGSDPFRPSSDIILSSNDTVRVDLNVNGDNEVGSFEVRDNSNNLLFIVDTNGDVCIGNC